MHPRRGGRERKGGGGNDPPTDHLQRMEKGQHPPQLTARTRRPTDRYRGPSSFPRLALVRHGRRRGARPLPRRRARRRRLDIARRPWAFASPAPATALVHTGCGAKRCEVEQAGTIGAGCELSTSRVWCSILESSVTSSRLNTSCTRLCREDINRGSASRLTLTASTQHPRKIGRTE